MNRRVNGTITIPGPETLVLFGVHIKVLSAIFGVGGIVLGHLMTPRPAQPLEWRRQMAVILAGVLVSISITIAAGQRPLIVMGWSIGLGFAGIAVFQAWGAQAGAAAKTLGEAAVERLGKSVAGRKDDE